MNEFAELYVNGLLSSDDLHSVFEVFLEHEGSRNLPRDFRGIFSLDDFDEEEAVRQFRFEKRDLPRLQQLLGIPHSVHTGGPNGYRVPGLTALCVLLRRLAYPNRWSDLEIIFGMSKSALSAIVSWTTRFIVDGKGHILTDLGRHRWLDVHKLATYAEAVEDGMMLLFGLEVVFKSKFGDFASLLVVLLCCTVIQLIRHLRF
ncbi:hypothetical protein GE061_010066 [Apolygus lucorum]|uniref:DDE Tnp4 domain-containing protein n=1 Tax=Apolygus lucorum TaxID=248454 RepID=A0A8S9Y3B3_APOLU|nr:hypothetical protein GE061_010066 [Apolygus lucorum]